MSSEDDDYNDVESVDEDDQDKSGKRVQVCLRLRPMNKFETSRRSKNCVELHDDPRTLTVNSPLEGEYDFSLDRVFDETTTQVDLFEEAVYPMMESVFEGINCTVISYGQSGSGKSHTMLGFDGTAAVAEAANKGGQEQEPEPQLLPNDPQDGEGVIPRVAEQVFEMIQESSPNIEFTVRCSYVEIFLEKILDLLTPGGVGGVALRIVDEPGDSGGVKILGASELCSTDKPDVISLLNRGNAFRTASGVKMSTDSSRSHVAFLMKIEQRNRETGEKKSSVIQMLDLAGSEAASVTPSSTGGGGQQIQQTASVEAMMNNKSIAALTSMVRAQRTGQTDVIDAASSQSKLTRLLRPSFGGNCITTVLLTASPSSYNIGETINTLRFGKCCRRIWNSPNVNTDLTHERYQEMLNETRQRHETDRSEWIEKERKLKALVKILAAECKGESETDPMEDSHVILAIEEALQDGDKATKAVATDITKESEPKDSNIDGDLQSAQEEILRLRKLVEEATEAKDRAENSVAELQSEVAVLRSKNEFFSSESKKAMQELIDAEYEIQVVSQRKTELEHDLRMNQFREKELSVFLRQFRRFFMRLMKHRGAHGNGKVEDLIAMVPGVPDMKGMIDIDKLLLERGIIDEDDLEDPNTDASSGQQVTAESLEVDLLQRELLKVTEQCIELQIGLKEQQESATTAAMLAQGWGSMKRLLGSTTEEHGDLAKDAMILKQQLERKNHDLQAVVWKMNELHVINETFNDKMASREQRVIVLEKKLVDLQKVNGLILLSSQESEKKLRKELDNLRSLVDGMTIPLWQFGESRIKDRTIASRIILPVVGEAKEAKRGMVDEGDC